jgi:acetyl esterase
LRLLQSGVPTELHNFPGTFHGSWRLAGAAISRRQTGEMVAALRRALQPGRLV